MAPFVIWKFQCSSASRKFLNQALDAMTELAKGFQCSSASRKFLNQMRVGAGGLAVRFQCSSASRKFLNKDYVALVDSPHGVSVLFSEPKIPQCRVGAQHQRAPPGFQCSSASRKFLNFGEETLKTLLLGGFSALQRAENSSMTRSAPPSPRNVAVSVLFSEPKIPQFA